MLVSFSITVSKPLRNSCKTERTEQKKALLGYNSMKLEEKLVWAGEKSFIEL